MVGMMAAAAGSLLSTAFKGISGGIQAHKGKKAMESIVRPTYTRPTEVTEAENIARQNYYNTKLPGQATLEGNLAASTAQGLGAAQQAATSSGDVLDSINKLYAGEQNQISQIGMAAAQQQLKDAQALQQQLGVSAEYADQEFQYNLADPYQQEYNRAQSMIAAGNQNVNTALSELGKSAVGIGLYGEQAGLFGGGQTMGETAGAMAELPTVTGTPTLTANPTQPIPFAGSSAFRLPTSPTVASMPGAVTNPITPQGSLRIPTAYNAAAYRGPNTLPFMSPTQGLQSSGVGYGAFAPAQPGLLRIGGPKF